MGSGEFKDRLSDLVIARLEPIRAETSRLEKNLDYVERVLADGGRDAAAVANDTLGFVKSSMGL